MKVIDVSWPISTATTGYKDRAVVKFDEIKNFAKDGVRETNIQVSAHTGTHIDAPSHFLRDGKTIDQIDLSRFIGRCKVIDLTDVAEQITRNRLASHEGEIDEGDIVLLKTSNSIKIATDKFSPHFVYLEFTGAEYLKEKKIKAVGIDYLGIERSQSGHPTHLTLMRADIGIIEGLRLRHVK
ncbi:MAG TPA: cyclase family protein, partial [Candidatus Dependentiae bacterium]|nr:cyclase family protein [Candidatus Dependentiae bacterium]